MRIIGVLVNGFLFPELLCNFVELKASYFVLTVKLSNRLQRQGFLVSSGIRKFFLDLKVTYKELDVQFILYRMTSG